MTIAIDLPPEVAETLKSKAAQAGRDVAEYVRCLAMQDSSEHGEIQGAVSFRTPGLHAGQYWIAEDFDAPLPDSFWLGEDAAEMHRT